MSALSDLYALIPAQGFILGKDLPTVFARYEAQRDAELLQPKERAALEEFGRENAGVRVDAELLVGLMGQFLGTGKGEESAESGRATGFKGRQLTLADADMSLLDDTQPPFTPILANPPKVELSTARPASSGKPSTPASHIPRRRVPADGKSPLPPSSYTPVSRTAGTRRGSDPASSPSQSIPPQSVRSSSALSNHSYTPVMGSKIARPRPPRTSTSSRRSTSPSAIQHDRPSSRRETTRRVSSNHPADPFASFDGDSRGGVPGSPELPALKGVDSELSMLDETSFVGRGVGDVTVDLEGDDLAAELRRGSRLNRISTASTGSLASTHDALQALKRENNDLVKKKNELARQLQVIGAETEVQMADLQESLDGARAELASKRKEEKESRTREAQLGTQICTLELEMQHLQQQLSTARESHATQQRMLQDANGEADRLREALLGKEEDVAGLKGTIETYEDEKRSWQDQLETLQATNATLQTSPQTAQEAARTLERRKAENQELQQTIKRLTHELDILRTQQVTGGRHAREATDASGVDSVVSRTGTGQRMSLGDELRSVFDAEESDGEKEGKGKTVVRTVTYRTERVIHHRNKEPSNDNDNDSEPETSFVEEIVREYTDAGVATDPEVPSITMASSAIQTDETHHGALPPYSPRSDAEIENEALAHAHPALDVTEKVDLQRHRELALDYADMTMAVGLRCTVLEEKLQVKQDQAMRGDRGIMSRSAPPAQKSGLSLGTLTYLCAVALAVSLAGYYLGSRQNHSRQLDILRNMLQDYTLPYSHLYLQDFAPRTTVVQTFAGGVKQFAGRSPI